ncbi:hypothetical protein [Burkholderia sp. 22PA0106]|uniref:hypothetical protein n=1 Tax=Burkholderia sp. 22PA0106 TaxID=3237371 RepID=UPI0039C441A2
MPANPKPSCSRLATRILSAASLAALVVANPASAAQADTGRPVAPPPPAATGAPPPAPALDAATAAPPAPVPALGAPTAAAPVPAPPVRAPGRPGASDAPATAQGVVARFLINPDGEVDSLLTRDGTLVRFPPHLGEQLVSMVRPGDDVRIGGSRDAGGALTAQRITDLRSGRQLVDQPPLPGNPPPPPDLHGAALSRLDAQGQVAHVTTTPRGEPDGVILADGTVIRMTPPIAQQFPALVQTGATVSAQGYGTRTRYGTALQATAFGAPGELTMLYDRAPPAP